MAWLSRKGTINGVTAATTSEHITQLEIIPKITDVHEKLETSLEELEPTGEAAEHWQKITSSY